MHPATATRRILTSYLLPSSLSLHNCKRFPLDIMNIVPIGQIWEFRPIMAYKGF